MRLSLLRSIGEKREKDFEKLANSANEKKEKGIKKINNKVKKNGK